MTDTSNRNGAAGFLILTLAYWAASALAEELVIPPNFASIIWPSAGVALAGLLLLGGRAWIAIFIGSLLPHLIALISQDALSATTPAMTFPLIVAAGGAAQAWVGAWLVRRNGGFPNQLNDIAQVARLLFLGGPVSCLISASVGTVGLWAQDLVPVTGIWESWLTWWIGDSMGVFVAAPLVLFWLTPGMQSRIRRGIAVTFWSVASLLLCLVAIAYTKSLQEEMQAQKFHETASLAIDDLSEAFTGYAHAVLAAQAFAQTGNRSPGEFAAFAERIIAPRPGLAGLVWLSRDTAPDGSDRFQATAHTGGPLDPALLADINDPTRVTRDSRTDAMAEARDSDMLRISGPIGHSNESASMLLAFAPVYRDNGAAGWSLLERRRELKGYVVGVISLPALMTGMFHEQSINDFNFWIIDETLGGVRLAANLDQKPELRPTRLLTGSILPGTDAVITAGGHDWRITMTPSPTFLANNRFQDGWIVLVVGFLLTGMVACFVMITTGRESALRNLADSQTEALRQSEQKYRALTETTQDWVWELDRNFRFTYTSPRALELLGYQPQDLLGRPLLSLIPLPSTEMVEHEFLIAASELRPISLVIVPHRHRDGRLLFMEANALPLLGPSGEFLGFRGSSRDVTERKLGEDKLRRQYESLRLLNNIAALLRPSLHDQLVEALRLGLRHLGLETAIISRIKDGLYTVEHQVSPSNSGLQDGSVFPFSETYCAMTLAAGDVVAIAHMKESDHVGHPCYRAFKLESYIGAPLIVQGKIVGTVNFSSAAPYHRIFDDGDVDFMRLLSRWVGTSIERDQTMRALQSALDRVEAILANTPIGIAILSQERRFLRINDAFRAVFHIPEEEDLLGHSVREFYGSEDHFQAVGQAAYPMLARGEIYQNEAKMRRRDGAAIWIKFVARTVADGPTQSILWAIEDITDRKSAENHLAEAHRRLEEQARDLARSNGELEQFAYVASHDLRQPLRQVASYVTLLEREYADKLDDDAREFIHFARSGAERMDRLIVDLLEYSRIGRKSRPPEMIRLADIVTGAQFNLGQAIADAQGTLTISLPDDLPMVNGNPGELVRLFQNLIGNAVKYQPPGRAPIIHVNAQTDPEGNAILITVSDNGIGIPADQYERVFGIFQRLHGRQEYEGTGIGLAICKKIVEHHKGRIWLDSVEGSGTRFFISLPVGGDVEH